MTEAKQILLKHKGIELAYLEINSQKDGDPFNRRTKKKK